MWFCKCELHFKISIIQIISANKVMKIRGYVLVTKEIAKDLLLCFCCEEKKQDLQLRVVFNFQYHLV